MARKRRRNNTISDGPSEAKEPRSGVSAKRTIVRTHENKREQLRVKMHLERTKRSIQVLRERLETWDEVEEEEKKRKEKEPPPRKKKRTDPSTWKLKGAAKPAHEVYDFDVRFVDTYAQDHVNAKAKAQRQVNLLKSGNLASHELGREYLTLLMQLAHLRESAGHYRDAQATYQECMQLDSSAITNARESLMRLFIVRERYSEAYELGTTTLSSYDDTSMIPYSKALAAFALYHNKSKQQTIISKEELQEAMTKAIRGNIFLAHYICHFDIFQTVMECQDEIDEDEPQSLLEEAIEYANDNELMNSWQTLAADNALRSAMNDTDHDWEEPLNRLVQAQSSSSKVDRSMFAGMFKTAMEMVQEKSPKWIEPVKLLNTICTFLLTMEELLSPQRNIK